MHHVTIRTLLVLGSGALCANSVSAQWNSQPALNTPVSVTAGDHAVPKIAADGDGRTWLGWFDNRNGAYEVYVQLLGRDGSPLFAPNGLLVSSNPQSTSLVDWDLICDADGNAVLVFTDIRAGGDLDVYAYRISPSGQFLWGANGVALSNNAEYEPSPRCAALDDGSFAFVWGWLPSSGTGEVRVQKLDASGVPQFGSNGLAIPGATNEKPAFAQVVASDNGGCVVAWIRSIATFSSPRHLRAQKFDAAGNPLWNGGNPVLVFDALSLPIAYWPELESDDQGGALFAWHRAAGSNFDSFVQHVDSAGTELFAHNGLAISLEAGVMKMSPSLAFLPASGDMILAFHRRNSAQSMWGVGAQRISAAGARMWTDDGVILEALDAKNESFESVVPFGEGAIVAYFDNPNTPLPNARVLAQRLDPNGAPMWGASGVIVSDQSPANAAKDDLELALDATGLLRATWDDNRSNPSGDIYAQDVHYDGTLGPVVSCTATSYCVAAPNSAGPGANIGFSGSTALALGNFGLTVAGAPPQKNGLFFYGPAMSQGTPFHNGFKCVNGATIRFPVLTTQLDGTAAMSVDLNNPPTPAGLITAGSTWNFQFWYRDAAAPPAFSNTSDGLSAAFCD